MTEIASPTDPPHHYKVQLNSLECELDELEEEKERLTKHEDKNARQILAIEKKIRVVVLKDEKLRCEAALKDRNISAEQRRQIKEHLGDVVRDLENGGDLRA